MPPTNRRAVNVQLTREQHRLIGQEITRLRQEHDIILTYSEFFQVLLEEHRLKLNTLADEDSDAVSWMHTTPDDS